MYDQDFSQSMLSELKMAFGTTLFIQQDFGTDALYMYMYIMLFRNFEQISINLPNDYSTNVHGPWPNFIKMAIRKFSFSDTYTCSNITCM